MGSCASNFKDSNAAKKEAVDPPEEEKLVVVEEVKEDETAEEKKPKSLGNLFKEIDEWDEHEFAKEPREVNSTKIEVAGTTDGEKEKMNESISDPKQEFAEVSVTLPVKEEPIDRSNPEEVVKEMEKPQEN